MNKFMIYLINIYKKNTKNSVHRCKYYPTCSSYAKECYENYNFFYATILSMWRILRCNPFSKGGYDPIPKKKSNALEDKK